MKYPLLLLIAGSTSLISAQCLNAQNPAHSEAHALTLDTAIQTAIESDPWLGGSRHRQAALNSEATYASTLPDPKLSLMAGNFPVDTFDIHQENMTQVAVGISQMFPRGDSRALSSQQKNILAAEEPLQRQNRQAQVTATVTQLWLDAFRAQESINLIESDRALFEHLVGATRAGYSAGIGRARQQDIIRAQLELTQLEDRLTVLTSQYETAQLKLAEWIGPQALLPLNPALASAAMLPSGQSVKNALPSDQQRYERIRQHPSLRAMDQRINALQTGVELARQQSQPEWGVSAQYGYRADNQTGQERSDLFSLGITMDLPVFTARRQDKEVSAASARAEAMKTEKQLLARQMMAELKGLEVQRQRLDQRRDLYDVQLLPQMAQQAEAALVAYNNNDGDFAEAVRARIAELNTKIESLEIKIEQYQTQAKMRFLLTQAHASPETDL